MLEAIIVLILVVIVGAIYVSTDLGRIIQRLDKIHDAQCKEHVATARRHLGR